MLTDLIPTEAVPWLCLTYAAVLLVVLLRRLGEPDR